MRARGACVCAAALSVVALVAAGCSAADETRCAPGGACGGGDLDGGLPLDASRRDAMAPPDSGGPLPPPPPPPPSDAGPAPQPSEDADGLCLDGEDNDLDGLSDCPDPDCAAASSCCADNASCCGPLEPDFELELGGCVVDQPVASCTGLEPFGAVESRVDTTPDGGRSVSVGGELAGDSGVLLPGSIDAAGALALTARVGLTAAGCELGRCPESMTLAWMQTTSSGARVPWVELTMSLDLQRVVLVVEGRVAGERSLPAVDGVLDVELTVDASGGVLAQTGGSVAIRLEGVATSAPASVRAAVWGRSPNVPSAALRLQALRAGHRTCDRPRAMRAGERVGLQGAAPARPSSPSVALDPETGARFGALLDGGVVRGGPFDLTDGDRTLSLDSSPWLTPGPGESFLAVDLVHVAAAGATPWWLFVVVEDAGGATRVARLATAVPGTFSVAELERDVLGDRPAWALRVADVDALERPAGVLLAFATEGETGGLVGLASLDARATDAAVSADPILQPDESPSAFDRDAVGSPTLVAYRGLLHLFYAGRRGTSTSVGYLYSADGRYWRRYAQGAVVPGTASLLGALEPEATFDATGAAGDQEGTLELLYIASDGARRDLEVARRRVFVGASAAP